jgi:NAD(P)-dependent dehydrogenase (short-subunit alcohol dehydrogenase family)
VTGGNAGIGFETSRGLLIRGANVVVASRNRLKAEEACNRLCREANVSAARATPLTVDLADLTSVRPAVDALEGATGGRPVDVLIQNAGIWPQRFSLSAQGHEIAFATNVLGHFALTRELERRGLLGRARVVVVTGDIYTRARECSADFRYRGRRGGQDAYCRSKLGNLWFARELARRTPDLTVITVHPGVVNSNLVAGFEGIKRLLLLDCAAGAQASLLAASQPDLPTGSYIHNTLGLAEFSTDDPAADDASARDLWELCGSLARPFLSPIAG